MEELAEKLSVPLDTIDEPTRLLLENLTRQLGLVARQGGPVAERSIPPELREQRRSTAAGPQPPAASTVPPELRGRQATIPLDTPTDNNNMNRGGGRAYNNHSNTAAVSQGQGHPRSPPRRETSIRNTPPPRQRMSSNTTDNSNNYSTNYPPPDMEEQCMSSSSSGSLVTSTAPAVMVDYSHGRQRNPDAITSESILASLQSDLSTSSAGRVNGSQQSRVSSFNSSMPLKNKVQGFTQNIRMEIGNRAISNDHNQQNKLVNGFLPRQLHSKPNSNNVFDRAGGQHRPPLHQQRPLMGMRPNRPDISRKW